MTATALKPRAPTADDRLERIMRQMRRVRDYWRQKTEISALRDRIDRLREDLEHDQDLETTMRALLSVRNSIKRGDTATALADLDYFMLRLDRGRRFI